MCYHTRMAESGASDDARELIRLIQRERRCGVVHCVVEQTNHIESLAAQILDAFVGRHGMTGIGEDWVEVQCAAAMAHLTAVLHSDMAYGSEIMPRGRAADLGEQFLGLFAGGRFFTNTEDGPREPLTTGAWTRGWSPLTSATFDTGVLAVTGSRIGLVWVEDED